MGMLSVLCAFVLCFGAQCHVVVVFLWVFCRLGFDQTFADAADYPDPNSAFKIFRSLVGHLRGLVQTRATRK